MYWMYKPLLYLIGVAFVLAVFYVVFQIGNAIANIALWIAEKIRKRYDIPTRNTVFVLTAIPIGILVYLVGKSLITSIG